MKRKTNLFYTSGPDSKFLTFSNYAESLTGNFISTNHKLFPSKFLCMNIEGLTSETKESFIKLISAYYENKMAVLRDDCLANNVNIEDKAFPLAYFIEFLTMIELGQDDEGNPIFKKKNKPEDTERDDIYKDMFCYVGDISEEDYDGTYSDIICFIDLNDWKTGSVVYKPENIEVNTESVTDELDKIYKDVLYGWESSEDGKVTIPDPYKDVEPIFDSDDKAQYNYITDLSSISVKDHNDAEDELIFNVIIPLYDLVNVDHKTNTTSIVSNEVNDIALQFDTEAEIIPYNHNVPLGMWISTEPIRLAKDPDTHMCPTWSLLISSQFKVLPYYSKNVPVEHMDVLSNSKMYNTFASVIVRQNKLIDAFSKLEMQILNIQKRMEELGNEVKHIGTVKNIDSLHLEHANFELDMTTKFNNLKEEIKEQFKNLTWRATI